MKTFWILVCVVLVGCGGGGGSDRARISVIPRPVSVVELGGSMPAGDTVGAIRYSPLSNPATENPEAYRLVVDDNGVRISAASERGYPLALATLSQLVDPVSNRIPFVEVVDEPKWGWRGVMLDVAGDFLPVDSVLRVVDILAYHKFNKLQLNLSDNKVWRVGVVGYPRLTSDPGEHYSRADIRRIVEYAKDRGIEVIPQVNLPALSRATLAAYPHLGCSGVDGSSVLCTSRAQVYDFVSAVVGELSSAFDSEFIHIGGGDVPYSTLEKCKDCMALRGGGRELADYFVGRVSKIVENKNRRMIGWDDITRPTLSRKSVVMGRNGWDGALSAASHGNAVVMSPSNYLNLDHYQSQHPDEPQANNGDNTLQRVWSFPVVPFDMPVADHAQVLGGQASLWQSDSKGGLGNVEYMLLPRLAGLSEALWAQKRDINVREWDDFCRRLDTQFDHYKAYGWQYSESSATPTTLQLGDSVMLSSQHPHYPIHYTLDNTTPSTKSEECSRAIKVDTLTTIRAQSFRNGKPFGREMILKDLHNRASGLKKVKVKYATKPSMQRNGGGKMSALVDDLRATKSGDDSRWIGWEKSDMSVIIDMVDTTEFENIEVRFFQHLGATNAVLPKWVKVSVSENGTDFRSISSQKIEPQNTADALIKSVDFELVPQFSRFVKIEAGCRTTVPEGHVHSGQHAWIFCDEIIIK